MIKKLLCMIIAVMMIFSTSTFASSFSDIEKTDDEEAINIVSALGIMNGSKDGKFNPNDLLTRGQMAVIITNILFPGQKTLTSTKELRFTDVPKEYFGYAQIAVTTDLGIMSGTSFSTFEPDANITYEQAIKIMVSLLGYDIHANAIAPYPAGYVSKANALGILKGLGSAFDKEISRSQVAKLVHNSLDVPILQQLTLGASDEYEFTSSKDKTILTAYLRTHKVEGQVISNDYSSINKTPDGDGFVTIKDIKNNREIKARVGDNGIANALGLGVIALIKDKDATEHGDYEVVYYMQNDDYIKTFQLQADQIEAFDELKYELSYEKEENSDKYVSIKISRGLEMIVNGCYKEFNGKDDLLIKNGQINFVDTNKDGTYDLAIVENYYNIVVKNLSKSDGTIIDSYFPNRKVKLDLEDEEKIITFVDVKGNEATMFDISPYSVVSIYESTNLYGKNKIKAVLNNETTVGVIKSVDSDGNVIIDDKSYKISNEFLEYNKVNNLLISGLSTPLTLDAENRICGITSENPLDNTSDFTLSMNYGYLISAGCSGQYSLPQFKILTPDSKVQIFEGSEKILFNGVKAQGTAIINDLKNTSVDKKTPVSQLVKFKTNKDGQICSLNSAIMGTNHTEARDADKIYYDQSYQNKKVYKVVGDGDYALNNASIGFLIPPNIEHEDLMKAVPAVNFSYDKINSAVYDSNYRKIAKAVVVDASVNPTYENDDPTYVVVKTGERIDEEGTLKPYVELFKKDGSTLSANFLETAKLCEYDNYDTYQAGDVWTEDGITYKGAYTFIKPQDLNSGDVVRIAIDEMSGKISGVQRLFSVKGFKEQFGDTPPAYSYTYPFRWEASEGGSSYHTNYGYLLKWVTGYATDVDSDFLKIKLKEKASINAAVPYKEQFYGMRPTNAFSAYIVVDEKTDGTFRVSQGTYDDIKTSQMVGDGKESLVFFKSRYAICHEVYIFNFLNDVR